MQHHQGNLRAKRLQKGNRNDPRRLATIAPGSALAALCLTAQSARDAYRNLYRSWREADPSLELDAASAGDALASRAAKTAGLAAAYGAAHSAALKDTSSQQSQNLQWLSENLGAASARSRARPR